MHSETINISGGEVGLELVQEPLEQGQDELLVTSRGARKPEARYLVALRLVALALLTVGLVALSRHPALSSKLTLANLRARLLELGETRPALSFIAFIAIFCVGELLHVPGIVFMVLATLLFGRWAGFAAAYVGGLSSVCFSFVIVRVVGGQPIGALKWHRATAFVERMRARPIAAVALLRVMFWVAPPVNYLLAMSPIRFWDYLLGSALGLWPPVLAICLLADALLPWLEARGSDATVPQ